MADNQIDILINAVNNTTPAIKQIKQDLSSFKDSFESVKGGISQAGEAVEGLASRVKYLTNGFLLLKGFEFFKGIASQAAEVERLGTVLHTVAANAGITTTQIDAADQAIQKLGITAASSRQSLSQFVQAGLKVEDAARLARASQDLAVISGENSSQTFQGLTQAIEQQSIMMLRWRGILVTNEEAQSRYAAANGKSVAALADWEKKQALLEMTLLKSTRLTGIYEAAMGDVGKQAASLERYQTDAAVAIQNSLLPAYSEVVLQLTQFLRFVKLTADEQNASSTGAKSLAEAVRGIGGAFKDSLIWVIQHRDAVITVAKAYTALKAVQLVSTAVNKFKNLGKELIEKGSSAGKVQAEKAAASATEAHAVASEKASIAMVGEAASADKTTAALHAQALAEHRLAKEKMASRATSAGAVASDVIAGAASGGAGKAVGGLSVFGGAIRNIGALFTGLAKTVWRFFGGLPGIVLTTAASWLIWGNGLKTLGGLVDNLGTKFANLTDKIKAAFQNPEASEKTLKGVAERTAAYEERAKARGKEETPEYKEYKDAVNDRYQKESALLELEYQQAQIAEKLKGSYSSEDIERSHDIQKRIMAAKEEARVAGEVAEAKAKANKIDKKDQDLLKSEKDQEAYRKGKEYRQTQAVNDVFMARQNIGETKQIYGMSAPISMEMGNAISALRKEFDAYSKSLEGADTNVFRLTYTYKHFIEAAKTTEELIVGQQEFQKMLDESADRVKMIQALQEKGFTGEGDVTDGAKGADGEVRTDTLNPYNKQTDVKNYQAFEKLKKDAKEEAQNTGEDMGKILARMIAETLKAQSTLQDYGSPAKAMKKQMQDVWNSDKSAMNFFNSMVMEGKVSKDQASKMNDAEKLEAARTEAAKLNEEFSKLTVSRQQLDKSDMVFKSWQMSLAAVTKETENYTKALEKVQSLLNTVRDRKQGDMSSDIFKAESPSTLGNKRNVERIVSKYQEDMKAVEMQRERALQGVQADRAVTLAGSTDDLEKFYSDRNRQKEKDKAERERHFKDDAATALARATGDKVGPSTINKAGWSDEERDLQREKADLASGHAIKYRDPHLQANVTKTADEAQKRLDEIQKEIEESKRRNFGNAGTLTRQFTDEAAKQEQLRAEQVAIENALPKNLATDTAKLKRAGKDTGEGSDVALFDARFNKQKELEDLKEKGELSLSKEKELNEQLKEIDEKRAEIKKKDSSKSADKKQSLTADEEKSRLAALNMVHDKQKDLEKKKDTDKTDETAEINARQKAADAIVTADKAAAEKTRAINLKANEDKIKVTKEAYQAMQKELDSYISNYKAKVEALRDVHKGFIDYKAQLANISIGDALTNAQTKIYPDKQMVGSLEAKQTQVKLESTTQKYDEDLSSYQKLIDEKKALIRNSGATEKEIADQINQVDADSTAKRLSLAREYFSQLATQRDEAKAKYKQYADEVVSLEKEMRSTVIDANAAMREMARDVMSDPHAKYQDKKRELQEYLDMAKQAAQAGDLDQAKELGKKAQGLARGLAGDAEGAGGKYLATSDAQKGYAEATQVVTSAIGAQTKAAKDNRDKQLATVNDITEAMNSLGSQIKTLTTQSEIKLNVTADEAAIRALQDKLKSVAAEQDAAVKVVLDDASLSGLHDQIQSAISKDPYTIQVNADVNSTGKGKSDTNAPLDTGASPQYKADGGFIQGIGTGTSDSIPTMLSHGEFVIKQESVGHYGTNFLNLLNSKALKFAKGGVVSRFAEGGGPADIEKSFKDATGYNLFSNVKLASAEERAEKAEKVKNLVGSVFGGAKKILNAVAQRSTYAGREQEDKDNLKRAPYADGGQVGEPNLWGFIKYLAHGGEKKKKPAPDSMIDTAVKGMKTHNQQLAEAMNYAEGGPVGEPNLWGFVKYLAKGGEKKPKAKAPDSMIDTAVKGMKTHNQQLAEAMNYADGGHVGEPNLWGFVKYLAKGGEKKQKEKAPDSLIDGAVKGMKTHNQQLAEAMNYADGGQVGEPNLWGFTKYLAGKVFGGKKKPEKSPDSLIDTAVKGMKNHNQQLADALNYAEGGMVPGFAMGGMPSQEEFKKNPEAIKARQDERKRQIADARAVMDARERVAVAKKNGKSTDTKDLDLINSVPHLSDEIKARRESSRQALTIAKMQKAVAQARMTHKNRELTPEEQANLPNIELAYADGGEVDKRKAISEGFKKATGTSSLPSVEDVFKALGISKNKTTSLDAARYGSNTIGVRGETGGINTGGKIPALVSHGEFRISPDAVEHYGAGLLHAVNQMSFPKFAEGGIAGAAANLVENKPAKDASNTDIVKFVMEHKQKTHELSGSRESVYGLMNALRDVSAGNLGG